MKKMLFVFIAVLLAGSLFATPAFAAKPAEITVPFNQTQFQWRGVSAFGDWTPGYSYQNSATTSDYTLTGNVLHTDWSYSPLVTGLAGESTVYVYDKTDDVWVENEGRVHYEYVPGYGDQKVFNIFRGYLEFDGTPSADSFVHGVAYQWVYIFAPKDATLTGSNTVNAHWDDTINAWLVGFSIYLWDTGTQSYTTPFPDPFIEPVPANDYNPLGL
jgi:hypothetical protein